MELLVLLEALLMIKQQMSLHQHQQVIHGTLVAPVAGGTMVGHQASKKVAVSCFFAHTGPARPRAHASPTPVGCCVL